MNKSFKNKSRLYFDGWPSRDPLTPTTKLNVPLTAQKLKLDYKVFTFFIYWYHETIAISEDFPLYAFNSYQPHLFFQFTRTPCKVNKEVQTPAAFASMGISGRCPYQCLHCSLGYNQLDEAKTLLRTWNSQTTFAITSV